MVPLKTHRPPVQWHGDLALAKDALNLIATVDSAAVGNLIATVESAAVARSLLAVRKTKLRRQNSLKSSQIKRLILVRSFFD